MKMLADRNIKHLFYLVLALTIGFSLLSAVLLAAGGERAARYLPVAFACMVFLVLTVMYRYFQKQHQTMARAIEQLHAFLAGDTTARIECDEEGELNRLFHEVNALAAILTAHAENEGRAKQSMKETLSDISHQLKTPLAALNIYNGILQQQPVDPDTVREFTVLSEQELDRIQTLVHNLLTITKLDAGTIVLDKSEHNLSDLMADVRRRFAVQAQQQGTMLQVGDVIQLDNTSLTVVGVLKNSPFDTSDQPTVICSEMLFTAITGKDAYAILDVQLTQDATQQDVNQLQALANGQYDFYDRLAQNKDTQSTYFMFCLFVYGFLVVITLITIIHTANSIAMSVSARTRQYGAMRAVGMDGHQIQKMLTTESATYTLLGLVAGFGLGLPLHYFLYGQMITNYWGTAWHLPLSSVGGILVLLVCTALIVPLAPGKRICNMAVSETINEL